MLRFRPRVAADVDACVALARVVRARDGYPPYLPGGDFRRLLTVPEPLGAWVAVDGDEIVGHVALHAGRPGPAVDCASRQLGVPADRVAVVARLFSSPASRRRGIARALLETAADAARERGLVPILDVWVALQPALELYAACGWTRLATVDVEIPDGRVLPEHVFVAPDSTETADEPRFRSDLYRGTASYYDEFRLPYPEALIRDLLRRVSPTGDGRLLDLACGTGQVAFALREHFREVWAVDQEPDAIDLVRTKAARAGFDNVRTFARRAEDIDASETFDLVTIGRAFHRLARRRVADLSMRWLRAGGHLALLWGSSTWEGSPVGAWQHVFAETLEDWKRRLGTTGRVPANLDRHLEAHPHTEVLRDAGFTIVGRYEFLEMHGWSIPSLVGFVYSTSILPRAVFGDRAAAFERDVRDRLLAVEPAGVFREEASSAYDLAVRP